MLAVVLSGLLAWQQPPPIQDPAPTPAPAPAPVPTPGEPATPPAAKAPVEAWDDKTAKAAVEEWNKAMKGAASMAEKHRALEQLAGGSHKLLVKPLAQLIENEKLLVVRKRASELLANQPGPDAAATIRRLLKSSRVAGAPQVLAELVRGLARVGYDKADWDTVEDLFDRDYAADRVPVHEAVLELVAQHKEQQALPLLLRNLDEPVPENVDDASNPPREYWEARWKAWNVWKGKVKDALFAVTGQRFSTSAEAKAWLKANRAR
jgi:hypothetical protein